MRRFPIRAARSLVAAALSIPTAGSALAAEQVLMPYACRVQGGDVRLVPSPDTFYRIYGTRDKEVYTACAPDDPNRCRNWLVHRFDLDCGGTRVGWMKVAEAAARADRMAAWVDAGRMSLAMTPLWTIEREGPVYGGRWWRRARFEGPRGDRDFIPGRRGGGIVVLPPGYAPVLSTGARFFEAPHLETARAAPQAPPPPVKKPEVAPPSVKDSAAAGTSAAPTLAKEAAAAGESPDAIGATPMSTSRDAASSSAATKATAPASSVSATIINKPGATTAAPTPEPAAPQAVPLPPSSAETGKIATGSLQDNAASRSGVEIAVAGAATAALLLAGSLFFWSRRGRVPVTALTRDPARVSLGGLGRSGGLALAPPASVPAAQGDPAAELAMPSTIDEALAVIGASSGAAPDVIKKIVDGLRQSWHPDLARSEADRRYRERRLTQINVAWDILSGRQSVA